MAEPDLTFLGEIMRRVQDDMRELRGRVSALETNLIRLEGDVAKGLQHLEGRLDSLDDRIERLDGRTATVEGALRVVDAKLDRYDAAWDARFQQLTQTMTTNFSVVIEALKPR